MRRISDTIARLASMSPSSLTDAGYGESTRLQPLAGFGSNPGALSGHLYVPDGRSAMPLVVVLHGCTQTATGYDRGSGWSELAERFGFALLFPEQTRANNPNGCFNWFAPDHTRRDGGEAASIRQMVAAMVDRYPIDPARIFVTGLSAGGAMTSVMLATYPEVFAGGAIIAGLPYGAASSVSQAFDRMRGHGHRDDDANAAAIRAASRHRGPWPTVSIWHGGADRTVDAVNADHIIGQWRTLQGFADAPDREEVVDGHPHRMWLGQDGGIALEDYRIAGMGHGTPLGTAGDAGCGEAMPYMLEVGISSTWHIATRWGLLDDKAGSAAVRAVPTAPAPKREPAVAEATRPASGTQAVIEAALRSAGLLR